MYWQGRKISLILLCALAWLAGQAVCRAQATTGVQAAGKSRTGGEASATTVSPDTTVVQLRSVTVRGKGGAQRLREGEFSVGAVDVKSLADRATNLSEVIGRTAGVKVRTEGGLGSDFDISVDGLSGNAVRYFVDGVPLEQKGQGVNLANLPVDMIDRMEVYKGVVPAWLGSDALGGAVNIVTRREMSDFVDASYAMGSFGTHVTDVSGQWTDRRTGLTVRPSVGLKYSKNDYMMRNVEVWSEEDDAYVDVDRRRFHDRYSSIVGQLEAGFVGKSWADQLFVTASYSCTAKELQTGMLQTKVFGQAERTSHALGTSLRYQKRLGRTGLKFMASHTWDVAELTDTALAIYNWNGSYTPSSRNEVTGRAPSIRQQKRPLTLVQASVSQTLSATHSLSLSYSLNRTGNDRTDKRDTEFEPANDVMTKHIIGLTCTQALMGERLQNSLFLKDYIYAAHLRQKDFFWVTNANKISPRATKNYLGGGLASRFSLCDAMSVKASYEHSVRLPLSHELLGNGSTIYANLALRPESSDNLNIGVFGTWQTGTEHMLRYELAGYLRFVDDYIRANISEKDGLMQYANEPAVRIKGLEGEVGYVWNDAFSLTLNATLSDARNMKRYKSDGKPSATYRNRMPNRPWMHANADANYSFRLSGRDDRLTLGAAWSWIHWFYLSWEAYGAKDSKAKIPTQNVVDASVAYAWKDGRYSLALECRNMFDRLAYDNYKLQKPGCSFMAKLCVRLKREK